MAISLGFINLFLPIRIIDQKYPGGWAQFQKNYADDALFDDHLVRYCSGNPNDIAAMVETLDSLGFETIAESEEQACWQDCCVVDHFGRTTLPCGWLQLAGDYRSAYLKGTEPGEVVD
ncbi:MAG: hypothetical protein E6R15_08465 [Zoogloea sp.]|nr:MAG: hypothetical protein E6R15_08465 [Zoogloea sp.]